MDAKQTTRLAAFSDGVFAIAITLLVLDLKVPPATTSLLTGLVAQWPVYVAYVLSFGFILIMWMNHHWMLEHIVRVDSTFFLLNGLLLLGISVVPFPTSMVAEYVFTSEQNVAAAVYNGWFLLIAVLFGRMWSYASGRSRLVGGDDRQANLAQVITDRYRWGVPGYSLAFVLSVVWAPAGLLLNLLLAIFYALPREMEVRWLDRSHRSEPRL
ncbi:MAG TPA: TMEM175 family protein [Chloroflexota bacterium]